MSKWSGIRPLVRDPSAKNTESLVLTFWKCWPHLKILELKIDLKRLFPNIKIDNSLIQIEVAVESNHIMTLPN
jgi:hypothetical protein